MIEPLVSIGIPTYNRPNGLRQTLDNITKQSYHNLEIIISDNASQGEETQAVVKQFAQNDPRIKYFRQDTNKGASFNFLFVLEKSNANYFMWAADDDYFESSSLVERLVERCSEKVLVFPDFNIFDPNGKIISKSVLNKYYGDCQSTNDYLLAWCRSGAGYPVYGLYNIDGFKKAGLLFEFDNDLSYYNEGTFLHNIFLKGKVEFVPDISINVALGGSTPPDRIVLFRDFRKYIRDSFSIYFKTNELSALIKFNVLFVLMNKYSISIARHCIYLVRVPGKRKYLLKQLIFEWPFLALISYAPLSLFFNILWQPKKVLSYLISLEEFKK